MEERTEFANDWMDIWRQNEPLVVERTKNVNT